MNFKEGEVIVIDKPYNWTSFDVVSKVKKYVRKSYDYKEKIKVGHAGTLDPLATGIMIICTGRKTKEIDKYMADEKEYVATIRVGATTPSFDCETLIDKEFPFDHITEQLVKETLNQFIGEFEQMPPRYSAKKIDGQPAYLKAREGKHVEVKPALVNIKEIELLEFTLPVVKIKIVCGKGTYIRSLAHDLGKALNSGAYLTDLTRTRVGTYTLSQAFKIEDLEKYLTTA